jgi:hypothetical protein
MPQEQILSSYAFIIVQSGPVLSESQHQVIGAILFSLLHFHRKDRIRLGGRRGASSWHVAMLCSIIFPLYSLFIIWPLFPYKKEGVHDDAGIRSSCDLLSA